MQYVFVDGPASEDYFYKKCEEYKEDSESQNFQDVWALYENDFIQDGFYVEFGATDGIDGNTYLLSKKFNWSGILAEPSPYWFDTLVKNRKSDNTKIVTDCVYTETGKTLDFLVVDDPVLSTISGFGNDDEHADKRKKSEVVKVKTISLYDLLKTNDAPKDINYLSVDTEGSEYEILESFFNDKRSKEYNVKCITVEHNFVNTTRQNLYDLLTSKGYKRKYESVSRWDDFYVKEV